MSQREWSINDSRGGLGKIPPGRLRKASTGFEHDERTIEDRIGVPIKRASCFRYTRCIPSTVSRLITSPMDHRDVCLAKADYADSRESKMIARRSYGRIFTVYARQESFWPINRSFLDWPESPSGRCGRLTRRASTQSRARHDRRDCRSSTAKHRRASVARQWRRFAPPSRDCQPIRPKRIILALHGRLRRTPNPREVTLHLSLCTLPRSFSSIFLPH